jgi:hypothetical protein
MGCGLQMRLKMIWLIWRRRIRYYDSKALLGHGLEIKLAVGYRF